MIFASDLDRTLIYSSRFLETYGGETEIVEQLDSRPLSHMSCDAVQLLKTIHHKMLFIPTTTRSLEQYKRITLFQQQIHPKYAVVANGGMILKNNLPDPVWNEIIAQKMAGLISPQQLIDQNKWFFGSSQIKLSKSCDNLFAYAVYHEKPAQIECLEQLRSICAAAGYTVTPNGRKIYFIPNFMSKWEAVKYIMQFENETTLVASGDSILDEPLLTNCRHGIIPLHGELCAYYDTAMRDNDRIVLTQTDGLASSNELLHRVLALSLNKAAI